MIHQKCSGEVKVNYEDNLTMVRPSPLLLFLSSRSIEPRHCHPSSSNSLSCSTQKSSAINHEAKPLLSSKSPTSRWRQRTANKRRRTEELLDYIENDDFQTYSSSPIFSSIISDDIPNLKIPSTSLIDWDTISPELDPMRGGRIRSNDSAGMKRGIRKRLQIQAFYYLLETIIHQRNEDESTHRRHPPSSSKRLTIIDAGCGAGNLAISLAGLLVLSKSDIGRNVHILAVDINEVAL